MSYIWDHELLPDYTGRVQSCLKSLHIVTDKLSSEEMMKHSLGAFCELIRGPTSKEGSFKNDSQGDFVDNRVHPAPVSDLSF